MSTVSQKNWREKKSLSSDSSASTVSPYWGKHGWFPGLNQNGSNFCTMESVGIFRVWKPVLHTLRNANKRQTILCLISFSVCAPDKRRGYFCQFDIMYSGPRKWFKNNNNNIFDYPAADSFSQTLCLLISFNVLAGEESAGRMASGVSVWKKRKVKINFWQHSNISYWAWCIFPTR